jgi:hypothetical protein
MKEMAMSPRPPQAVTAPWWGANRPEVRASRSGWLTPRRPPRFLVRRGGGADLRGALVSAVGWALLVGLFLVAVS